jgi:hypothetical protein
MKRLAVAVRAARAVRGLWADHNPLRRTVDRVEAAIVAGLAVAFLAAAPLAAVAAWHAAYSMGSRTAHAQQAAWHQVPALPLTTVPASGYGRYEATVEARWTAPGGTRHTGTIPVPYGATAGRAVPVWVDAAGRLTSPPLLFSQVRRQAELAAILALLWPTWSCCARARWPTACWAGGGWPPGTRTGGQPSHTGPGGVNTGRSRSCPQS